MGALLEYHNNTMKVAVLIRIEIPLSAGEGGLKST